jgi:hypothetical protein
MIAMRMVQPAIHEIVEMVTMRPLHARSLDRARVGG